MSARFYAIFVAFALLTLVRLPVFSQSEPSAPKELPSRFLGSIVFLAPAVKGGTLDVLLDTGGYDLISPLAVQRLALPTQSITLGGRQRETVALSDLTSSRWLVARPEAFAGTFALPIDATLSLASFTNDRLAIDYRRKKVALLTALPSNAARVPLVASADPPPDPSLPALKLVVVPVTVDGEVLTMLLDTGATAKVRSEVRQVSFADRATFARWRLRHPKWPFYSGGAEVPGDRDPTPVDMLQVSTLRVGGKLAPPTWFLTRPDDETFTSLTLKFKRPVVGDLGGEALRNWRIVIAPGEGILAID